LKKYRIYIFLTKFKLNLKIKILKINNILNICNKLLAIIIIQKQILNCICKVDANNFKNQQIIKSFNISLDKSYQNRRLNNINKIIKSKKFYTLKNLLTLRKQVYKINNANYLNCIEYFKCYKKRYYKTKYLNKYK